MLTQQFIQAHILLKLLLAKVMELDHSAKLSLLDPPLSNRIFTLKAAAQIIVAEQ